MSAERRSEKAGSDQIGAEIASRVVAKAVGQGFGDAIHAGPSFFEKVGDDRDSEHCFSLPTGQNRENLRDFARSKRAETGNLYHPLWFWDSQALGVVSFCQILFLASMLFGRGRATLASEERDDDCPYL